MASEIVLTDAEKSAKKHFLLHFKEGAFVPCDIDISTIEAKLPTWYDEKKYKRGQKYFWENRFGIFHSNLIGLMCLLAEPRGLRMLMSTDRSSTVETARKRYISTILHTLSWYEYDLTPGSRSWESLNKVRKMHFLASKSAELKNIGKISQSEISFTAFGFMGFVITRPQLLYIRHNNREDLEGFIHLWAVILHMLGVQDKYNICLQPYDVLDVLCKMFLRYILLPIIQIETPEFRHMVTVMLEGLSKYLPNMNYEFQLFEARRIVGVPGYQYAINKDEMFLCKTILNPHEIKQCNETFFKLTKNNYLQLSYDIPIISYMPVIDIDKNENEINNLNDSKDNVGGVEVVLPAAIAAYNNSKNNNNYINQIEFKLPENIKIRYINYEKEWIENLNDRKFLELSTKAQNLVKAWSYFFPYYENFFVRYLLELTLSCVMSWLKKTATNA